MAGLVATWNGTPSSGFSGLYINAVERGAWGAPRSQDTNVPGRGPSWHFTEERGDRRISLACTLVASSPAARRSSLVELFNWLDVLGRKKLILSDQPDRYWYAAISNAPTVEEAVRLGRFNVDFTAEPYAYALTTSSFCSGSLSIGDESGSFNFPGDLIVDPEITITPAGGNLTGVTFTMNGDTITWTGLVSAGGTWTLSTISGTVLKDQSGDTDLTGAYDASDLDMADVSGTFPVIQPGTNEWSLTTAGSATSLELCWAYRRTYR